MPRTFALRTNLWLGAKFAFFGYCSLRFCENLLLFPFYVLRAWFRAGIQRQHWTSSCFFYILPFANFFSFNSLCVVFQQNFPRFFESPRGLLFGPFPPSFPQLFFPSPVHSGFPTANYSRQTFPGGSPSLFIGSPANTSVPFSFFSFTFFLIFVLFAPRTGPWPPMAFSFFPSFPSPP